MWTSQRHALTFLKNPTTNAKTTQMFEELLLLWLIFKLYRSLHLSLVMNSNWQRWSENTDRFAGKTLVANMGMVAKLMQQTCRDSFLNNTITFHLPMVMYSSPLALAWTKKQNKTKHQGIWTIISQTSSLNGVMEHFMWCIYFLLYCHPMWEI